MGVSYGFDTRNYKTASALLTAFPQLAGKDNYYMLYPQGPKGPRVLTWCDMTTDGGGYMLIARSHPSTINYNGTNWGWQGGVIGSVKDYTQAYQLGWWTYFNSYVTFSSFIFGNRNNINNNTWGPFIYKIVVSSYSTFTTSDTQQSPSSKTVLKYDTNIYGSSNYPNMQNVIGFPVTGTANNVYYLRDCCGFSASYGAKPTSMGTTYCSSGTSQFYAGPWCNGSTTDGSGNFVQGGSSLATNTGGTNQYMIMVK